VGFTDLEYRFVEESAQVLAAPTGHRLARKRTLEWQDFHDEEMVVIHPSLQHGYYDPFLAACARAGATPRPTQFANDIQTKMWLISAGFGIAPTTATLAEVRRSGLVYRPLPHGLPAVQTAVVWRKNDDSLALQAFIKLVSERRRTLLAETFGEMADFQDAVDNRPKNARRSPEGGERDTT
jgi:DNA-binding transcriptional LysR family regulator